MNIVTILGARPQFIKASVISRIIRDDYSNSIEEIIIHTGQHFDHEMSTVFFDGLDIPKPKINLNVKAKSHGEMTGLMLIKIEKMLLEFKPDVVFVYGDTNSTLAGALAASKLGIPIAHVEAGLRSFWQKMPEEQNRVITDNLSTFLFCPTETAKNNLVNEGINQKNGVTIQVVGDVMCDALLYFQNNTKVQKAKNAGKINKIKDKKMPYYLLTLHRQENTDDKERFENIISALNEMKNNYFVWPIHPRAKKMLKQYNITLNGNIKCIKPVGYFEMVELEANSNAIITDSGGVQKEAYLLKKPCITLREQTEWTETSDSGWNKLVGANKKEIIDAVENKKIPVKWFPFYGDGTAGKKIVNVLL